MAVLRPSGVSVLASYIIFNFLSTLAVILRFVAIRIRGRKIQHHDYLCVLALICSIAYSIDTLIGTVNGSIGLHIQDAMKNPAQLTLTLKTFFASQWFWSTGVCSFRVSMLLLYLHIFPQREFRWCTYGAIATVTAFWIGSLVTTLTACRPIRKNWYPMVPGTCLDIGKEEMGAASINMILDIVIVAMPLPIIWKLQMSTDRKIAVTATFTLGLSIASINLARIMKILDCDVADFTYCTRDSAILTVAETAIGVIVACVPTLGAIWFPARPGPASLLKKVGRGWRSQESKDSLGQTDNSAMAIKGDSDYQSPNVTNIYRGNSVGPNAFAEYSIDTEMEPLHKPGVVEVRKEFAVTTHSRI